MSFVYARVDDSEDSLILEKEVKFTAGSSRMTELQALLEQERRDLDYADKVIDTPMEKNSILIEDWNDMDFEEEPDEMRQTIETIFNPDADGKDRFSSLNKLFRMDSDDGNMTLSVINHTLATHPGSHILETILQTISQTDFPVENSYRLIHSLFLSYPSRRHDILDDMNRMINTRLPTPLRANLIKYLIMNDSHQTEGLSRAKELVLDSSVDIEFRLRFILDLHTIRMPNMGDFHLEKSMYEEWSKSILMTFIRSPYIQTSHRVIVANILLGKYILYRDESDVILSFLLGIGRDTHEDYNTRADALDIVVSTARRLGHHEIYIDANAELHALGVTRGGRQKDIYGNAQNVHEKSIVQSALKVLEYVEEKLSTTIFEDFDKVRDSIMNNIWSQKPTKPNVKKDDPLYLEYVKNKHLYKMKRDAISYSMTRISLDYAVYGRLDRTLMDILCMMWAYINKHKYKDELIKRLEEELIDASGLCSTGHAFRLLNIISGYDEIGIGISIEDEFMVKSQKLLNDYIMGMKEADDVLGEMTEKSDSLIAKDSYRRFISNALTNLESKIWDEFSGRIDHTDFNIYMRKLMMKYDDEEF